MAQALDGVRVLDCSTGLAGPMAAMMLADFGADVVKAEPPGGDPARADAGFVMWNRGKRSIVVDRDDPAGRARLDALLAGADLVVVSGPRDALAGGPLDPEAALAAHPHLVHLHLGPYTDTAPWAGAAESAALVAAETGVADRQFSFEDRPVDSVAPHLGYCQAVWGATCGLAALLERDRSGFGQRVLVGGLHGMVESCSGALVLDPRVPLVHRAGGPGGPNPFYRPYRCADGGWLFLAALTAQFRMHAALALDVVDLFADERLAGDENDVLRPEHSGWVTARLAAAFATRSRDEWLDALEAQDCPTGPVLDRDEWLDHDQIRAIGMRVEVDDPERGPVVLAGQPLNLTATPARPDRPAPTLGQHDAEVGGWDPRPAPTGEAPRRPGPLTGIRVLDLGTMIAGAFAGALLAELGADVTKVEPLTGDGFRFALGFPAYNVAKDGLAIDLRRPEGRTAFLELVRGADLVLDNFRPGVLERLGIAHDHLATVRPDIVTLSTTGFGEGGPISHRPGFDPVLQAMSGIMAAQGGDSDPVFMTLPVNDVLTAATSAFGALVALRHRERTGEGQRTWTSLAGVSCLAQSGELVRYDGRAPAPRGCPDFPGPGPLDRYYRTSDGWVRLQATGSGDLDRLARAGFLAPSPAAADDDGLVEALSAAFLAVGRDEAWRRLTAAGVAAGRNRTLHELIGDEAFMAEEPLLPGRQSSVPYLMVGRFARLSRTQRDGVATAPGLGSDTTDVLRRGGLDEETIAHLLATGVVHQGEPLDLDRSFR